MTKQKTEFQIGDRIKIVGVPMWEGETGKVVDCWEIGYRVVLDGEEIPVFFRPSEIVSIAEQP